MSRLNSLGLVLAALLWLPIAASGADKPATAANQSKLATAIFGGGCFWCVEADFDKVPGVVSTTSGYTGGRNANPSYEQVSAGGTGHVEVVKIVFDPQKVSYDELLQVFWRNIDPLDAKGQFCDKGDQYRSEIFYLDEEQRRKAEASKAAIEASHKLPGPIVTKITAATEFYPAEEYHQNYYEKNSVRYRFYRYSCARDHRLQELWGEKRSS